MMGLVFQRDKVTVLMGIPHSSHLSSVSCHFQALITPMALKLHSRFSQASKLPLLYFRVPTLNWRLKPNHLLQSSRPKTVHAMNMAAGQPGEPENKRIDALMHEARELWDSSPQLVKTFTWNGVLENFIQLILHLTVAVVKYLSVPLLAVSSISEMAYCANEKKLFLVPFSLLIGVALARFLNDTALENIPLLQEAEIPWHLIPIAIFFTLIKLPGPYYPYWERLFIPHLANGALWTTLLLALFCWTSPRKASTDSKSVNPDHS